MNRDLTMVGRPSVDSSRGRRSWIALGASIALLAIGLWLVFGHVLVNLSNSREGFAIVPGTIAPGGTVAGQVDLANRGWLPISISLQPDSPDGHLPAKISVKVRRADGLLLYVGPLQKSMGPLLVLQPGEQARILLTVVSDDPNGTAAVALPVIYSWAAVPALPWWWWIPVLLLVLGLLSYGFHRSREAAQ